jgi:glycosyltransferase involved in cell wall biosynthesis
MKPRLLLVSRKWPPAIGGMETYSVELAASMDGHFDVHRLVLPGRADGHTPGLAAYAMFTLRAMLFCLVRGRRFPHVVFCDLVLFPAALCHWLVARRGRRVVVVYGLDLVYQTRRGALPALYRVFFSAFRAIQGIFDAIVAISRHTAGLAHACGLRQVTVVPPSLPDNALTRADAHAGELPATWREASRRILYFGRLVPRKGALWFARSVMPRLDPSVDFFVVGQSSDTAYRERLRESPRTHCLGRQPAATLAALIRAADVVVMPNIPTPTSRDVEGFGLAAIEASALGGRLLAAAIDGITDAVIDTETGVLLPAENADAWTRAVEQALRGESLRDRARIAAVTRRRYSRSAQSSAFERLLLAPTGHHA